MAFVDITGMRFGRLTVERLAPDCGRVKYWLCRCDCGAERRVFGGDLKRGNTTSCGCYARAERAKRMTTHGMVKHPAYGSWQQMKNRCTNPAYDGFDLYGGRGISVAPQWMEFEGFWADMAEGWFKGGSIDRLDVNGSYEPGNCAWATPKEQANNRRDNHVIATPWGPMTVTEAAERSGINRITIFSRLRYGWPEDRLLEPVRGSTRT